jgi:hypothetical protein
VRLFTSAAPISSLWLTASLYERGCPFAGLFLLHR